MKKHINLSIEAYLLQGAFYSLLLLAACAISFALAQENSANHGGAKHATLAKPGKQLTNKADSTAQRFTPTASADAAPPGHASKPLVQTPRTETPVSLSATGTSNLCPEGWNTSTTGPPERYRGGACTDGTFVYVYGGSDSGANYLNDLWRWNPATETWTQLANMPTGKQNIQGAYWNGKIYVPGGYTGTHITENAIYNVATNTWTTGAPLPNPQTGANVAFNGKIYNFGGNPGPLDTVTIYNIASNTWTTGASMPVAISYGRAAVAGNFAYYAGGITSTTVVNTLYRYNFAANSWATMSPLQTARTSEELMTSPGGDKLYAVMGGDASFFTGVPLEQSVEIYDIASDGWSYGVPVVTKAAAPAGGLARGKAMVQGGVDGATYYDTVQVSLVMLCGGCEYGFRTGTDSIVPGNSDIGSHCDDCDTMIALPFSFELYDQTFNAVNVSSNGRLDFVTANEPGGFASQCLPASPNQGPYDYTIFPLWSDYHTGIVGEGCTNFATGCGVFTSVSGTAPNRIFNIEWRVVYFADHNQTANFEVRLYENNPNKRFDVIFGTVQPGSDQLYGSGVQGPLWGFTEDFCDVNPPSAGSRTYACAGPPTDFNRDAYSDLVLYNTGTRQTAIWFLTNSSFAGSSYGPTPPPGWNVVDVADFDGDGNSDYALFNPTTRQTAIWYLSGTNFSGSSYGPTPPNGWALVAVSDLNHDGHPDFVLYNATTRRTAIWFLNNNSFTGSSYGPTPPPGWLVAGVGDFNRDRNPDYVLFNASTRQSAIWYLSGTSFISSAYGPTIAPAYQLIGVADFNLDRNPDYLLFKATTRQTAIWYLNNNSFAGSAYGPTPPSGWVVVAP